MITKQDLKDTIDKDFMKTYAESECKCGGGCLFVPKIKYSHQFLIKSLENLVELEKRIQRVRNLPNTNPLFDYKHLPYEGIWGQVLEKEIDIMSKMYVSWCLFYGKRFGIDALVERINEMEKPKHKYIMEEIEEINSVILESLQKDLKKVA